ncbi:MAG: 3-isopropylmalate dehydratase small subunit [Chloroflexi bacterium HGW-Chloroflexi-9]|nr:MAG: 3-isopropylmalate dehydratase small subunit [Chloroflexi bacterium HGW-Chloroflexi-9]
MRQIRTVRGRAIPLNKADVDTDQIMPKQFLKRIERSGFGPFAFEAWRKDPDFVLNVPAYQGAPIMLAQQNFGSGSSREHAVWGLEDMGIQAVIAPSFADIFRNNCSKVGLLTIVLPQPDIDYLMARHEELPTAEIVIDVEAQTIGTADGAWTRTFEIDPFIKHRTLNGLDDIGITMQHDADIAKFEERRKSMLKPDTKKAAESTLKIG